MTPEQYYNGKTGYHDLPAGAVRKTMDSVIAAMAKDKRRKFSISEIYYFKMWYSDQKEEKRNLVKDLIREGRLEILGTGIGENDEATTYFEDIIDNKFNGIKFAREY